MLYYSITQLIYHVILYYIQISIDYIISPFDLLVRQVVYQKFSKTPRLQPTLLRRGP